MSRRGRVAANVCLAVLSVGVGVALAEGGLRVFFPQPLVERYQRADAGGPITRRDPELGWTIKPDVAGLEGGAAWETTLTTNADGFRDGPHPEVKAPGVYRVAVLGDSFVFGSGVPQEAVVTRRLAVRLGAGFEVVNLGVPGYGTDQELLTLRRWGPRLRPDLVLAGFFWNDVMENASTEIYGLAKPHFTLEGGRLVPHPPAGVSPPSAFARLDASLASTSHLWSLARNGLASARAGREERPVSVDLSLKSPPASREGEFALTFALLEALRVEADTLGAPLVVFSVPPRFLVDDAAKQRVLRTYGLPPDAFDPDGFRRVREACEARGVTFLDLLPGFRSEAAAGARLFLPTGIHWSAAGHEAAARLLTPVVRGEGPVRGSRPAPAALPLRESAAPGSGASAR